METKLELASYLCNLISIMESREDAGIDRGPHLGKEYDFHYHQLKEIIADETRDREGRQRAKASDDGQGHLFEGGFPNRTANHGPEDGNGPKDRSSEG